MRPEQIAGVIGLRQALARAGGLAAVDRFVGQAQGLSRGGRDLVLDWADNHVRGVFELRGRGTDADGAGLVGVLNLIDDLEYRVYGLDPVAAGGGFFAGQVDRLEGARNLLAVKFVIGEDIDVPNVVVAASFEVIKPFGVRA